MNNINPLWRIVFLAELATSLGCGMAFWYKYDYDVVPLLATFMIVFGVTWCVNAVVACQIRNERKSDRFSNSGSAGVKGYWE